MEMVEMEEILSSLLKIKQLVEQSQPRHEVILQTFRGVRNNFEDFRNNFNKDLTDLKHQVCAMQEEEHTEGDLDSIPLSSVFKNPVLFLQPLDLPFHLSFPSSINARSDVDLVEKEYFINNGAKNQITMKPINTVFKVRSLIGHRFSDASVQSDITLWPFMPIVFVICRREAHASLRLVWHPPWKFIQNLWGLLTPPMAEEYTLSLDSYFLHQDYNKRNPKSCLVMVAPAMVMDLEPSSEPLSSFFSTRSKRLSISTD
ncbi:hypothetical protein F2P56_022543 [Juglans regia]|uniref:Uncharacterized protein LOC109008006 n=2 Tax=Juglans regia TaxID=51240 RepID=A0A2I4GHW4_JUGRE|nr:uncharacterized protein LOC109008006 [Juglans regia]KAF5458520.1 hypothetical protein F2P56_022543 [Juglans regia]